MHAELRAVREEWDRLCYELVNSRAEVADYREILVSVLTHSWNLSDRNWRRTVTRLVSVSGWRKGIMLIFPKRSTPWSRLSLHHRKRTLHRLSLLQACSRCTPALFQHIPRPRRLRGRLSHRSHQPPPSVLPVYSGTLPTHPPPPASSGAPQPP
ncbi:hypothetical protein CRG98_013734, partial [Punica granatum]